MEELLNDFLAETAGHLEQVGAQIVHFEQDPSNTAAIANIFRLVHTIKGTCGFLELNRLERLAHAAEALISLVRDTGIADSAHVSLILASIDRIRLILNSIEANGQETPGDDSDLIRQLAAAAAGHGSSAIRTLFGAGAQHRHDGSTGEETSRVKNHATEQIPAQSAAGREASSIRVAVGTLEHIMRLVSELVLTRNQLLEIARTHPDEELSAPLQRLSSVTSDLQDGIMHARMQPIERLFGPLPRMIRDLARELGKKVELVLDGADTELDRQMVDLLRDPLTHIIRNCLDHGIETPHEREAAGKPDHGTITISASHDAGHISIRVSDDGCGLDVARIRNKAITLGLITQDDFERLEDDEICRFIFMPGFSTAQNITNISGRGIGMDVVRENIESIGGSVSLSTFAGRGTTFALKVPLTLAIAPALILSAGGQRYAIPQHAVVEAVFCKHNGASRLKYAQGVPMLELRDQLIPAANMRSIFNIGKTDHPDDALAVILRTGAVTFALIADHLGDVQEIVVKPLDRTISHLGIYSGSTILGDGSVVLILNPHGLAAQIGLDGSNLFSVNTAQQDIGPERKATGLILFRAGKGALKALPLALVSRIENLVTQEISIADRQLVATHRDTLIPLIVLGDIAEAQRENYLATRDKWPALIVDVGGEPMGLLVSEIVDIVEEFLDIDIAGVTPAIIGSAMIRGEAAEVLDLAHFMKMARPNAFERGHARRFRVMLVDDKLFFRDLLAPLISAIGYEVTAVGSGAEALAILKRSANFDIVITDVDMPDMNGYALTRLLSENSRTRNIPVIALDAHAGESVAEAARNAGMRGVVGKFDRQGLLAALRGVLEATAFTSSAIEENAIAEQAA